MGRKLINAFKVELDKIKSDELRDITKKILSTCPDYICECSTSSSNKYHPEWSNGKGGLIRHTKAVCAVLERMLTQRPQYDTEQWDIPYIAAILHDMCKYTEDKQEHSHNDHPIRMGEKIREYQPKEPNELFGILERIIDCITTHMSRWNKDKQGKVIGWVPENEEQHLVATADMIVAGKFIHINFDENNNLTN